LCIEDEKIVGCLGIYLSLEQKVVRLLGPIISGEFFDRYADELYRQCLQNLPAGMKEVRIAFYEENAECSRWCQRNGFALYNSEMTLVRAKSAPFETRTASDAMIAPYAPVHRGGLALVHPKDTFFTLN
jgi:hypothetical protein